MKDWPIKIKTPDTYTDKKKTAVLVPGEERSAILNPGDGIIYSGCDRPHWRDAMPGIPMGKKSKKLFGKKLYNTYYYDRYYFPGQELTKHVDREACEISVSIHISNNLPDDSKDWSFNIKTPDTYTDSKRTNVLVPGEVVSVYLNPGDGVIYKGCERPHWRDHMPSPRRRKRDILLRRKKPEYYYHQIFFHYVLADGLRSYLKGDIPKLNAVELEP